MISAFDISKYFTKMIRKTEKRLKVKEKISLMKQNIKEVL